MKFESIEKNQNGDFYIIYSLPSKQKITKAVRDANKNGKREVIIVGIPKKKFRSYIPNIFKDVDEWDE